MSIPTQYPLSQIWRDNAVKPSFTDRALDQVHLIILVGTLAYTTYLLSSLTIRRITWLKDSPALTKWLEKSEALLEKLLENPTMTAMGMSTHWNSMSGHGDTISPIAALAIECRVLGLLVNKGIGPPLHFTTQVFALGMGWPLIGLIRTIGFKQRYLKKAAAQLPQFLRSSGPGTITPAKWNQVTQDPKILQAFKEAVIEWNRDPHGLCWLALHHHNLQHLLPTTSITPLPASLDRPSQLLIR